MPAYVPILKAKAGELEALQHLEAPPTPLRPLLELMPPSSRQQSGDLGEAEELDDAKNNETGHGPADPANGSGETRKLTRQLRKLALAIRDDLPAGSICSIDASYIDTLPFAPDAWECFTATLTEQLEPAPIRPVFRLTDPPERLAWVRGVIAEFGEGACLRLGSPDRDVDVRQAAELLSRVLPQLELGPEQIGVVIDLWTIEDDRDLQRGLATAEELLKLTDQHPWQSVTVAGGAFPASISHLPGDAVSPLPRRDAHLWRQLQERQPARLPDFGDYAIAHPAPGIGSRAPLPNLRYTTDTEWQIWRQRTPQDLGNERFCIICRDVVASEHFPTDRSRLCWGDRQIATRSEECSSPGNATKWRAFGTSRHLALVSDRLARCGEP
ncbi:hypothetical protein [Actinomadura sp. K4S16]|uniref:beta family protein n=1 Tax=Actinomadura sp. K4S16 TaxID=1316147 RepID=UPI00135AC410|nr:hypothetical protein [Actinomadura sp. K4S16]